MGRRRRLDSPNAGHATTFPHTSDHHLLGHHFWVLHQPYIEVSRAMSLSFRYLLCLDGWMLSLAFGGRMHIELTLWIKLSS